MLAGNPAKVICSLDEYREKRQKAQLAEAIELVREYEKVYGKVPPKEVLAEFFWLFEERVNLENAAFIGKMKCVNNYEVSLETFLNGKPLFHGYDSFIEYALKNGG